MSLPRSAPEAQGLASSAVLAFVEALERENEHLHSLMLLRHGHVVAEGWWAPYAAELPHMLFSLSKSFTATAVGLAVAEGLLSLDDPVLGFFPAERPAEVGPHLAAMCVRHLLSMSTGHADDTMNAIDACEDGNWARAFLACPVEHAPGTHFLYNTGATYMLSAILQGLTGMRMLEYLQPRLLEPLGIVGATWQQCPRGIDTGGFGLSTTTAAVAAFGQLYLQGGLWQGRQLVPADWVREATRAHISNGDDPASDWAQGYGYQFWRCRHGAYRGDGAFGQYCVVLPEQDAVLVMTGGLDSMQPPLSLAWEHLLPAFAPQPLPADPAAHAALQQKLAGLALPTPAGLQASPIAAQVSGKLFRCDANSFGLETLSLRFATSGCTIVLTNAEGEHLIAAGAGQWQHGQTSFMGAGATSPIAAAGAWVSADTYLAKLWFTETPFCATLSCCFADDLLLFDIGLNVSFGPTTFPQVLGRLTPT